MTPEDSEIRKGMLPALYDRALASVGRFTCRELDANIRYLFLGARRGKVSDPLAHARCHPAVAKFLSFQNF
jgi:hypothetical protein